MSSVGAEAAVVSSNCIVSGPPSGILKACMASERSLGTHGSLMSTLVMIDGFMGKAMAFELASRATMAVGKRIVNVGNDVDDLSW